MAVLDIICVSLDAGFKSVKQLYRLKELFLPSGVGNLGLRSTDLRLCVNRMNKTKCFILSPNGFVKDTEMKWPEVQLRDKRKLNCSRNGFKKEAKKTLQFASQGT